MCDAICWGVVAGFGAVSPRLLSVPHCHHHPVLESPQAPFTVGSGWSYACVYSRSLLAVGLSSPNLRMCNACQDSPSTAGGLAQCADPQPALVIAVLFKGHAYGRIVNLFVLFSACARLYRGRHMWRQTLQLKPRVAEVGIVAERARQILRRTRRPRGSRSNQGSKKTDFLTTQSDLVCYTVSCASGSNGHLGLKRGLGAVAARVARCSSL